MMIVINHAQYEEIPQIWQSQQNNSDSQIWFFWFWLIPVGD